MVLNGGQGGWVRQGALSCAADTVALEGTRTKVVKKEVLRSRKKGRFCFGWRTNEPDSGKGTGCWGLFGSG